MARPASPPTSTYRDKYQEEMAKKLQSDSYFGIIDSIKSAELQRAPNLNASRITTRLTPRWEKIACFLLLQLDIRVLHAILNNTLPSLAFDSLRFAVRTIQRTTSAATVHGDPVVYINWLADKEGHGLTVAEYREFIDAMEVATRLEPDKVSPSRQFGSLTIQEGVQEVYEELGGLGLLISDDDVAGLEKNARIFVAQNRKVVLKRAEQQGDKEIMVRAEVGWAASFKDRAKNHTDMTTTSPSIFRIANCLLRHLFPDRDFQMYQYAIFNITDPNEAAIGESILSHMAASYISYGGFNVAQAGVHTWSAFSNGIDWRQVASQAVLNGYFRHFTTNANTLRAHQRAEQERVRKALKWHENHALFLEEQEKTKKAVDSYYKTHYELLDLIQDTEEKLAQLRRERIKAEEAAARREQGRAALRDLLAGLAMIGTKRDGNEAGESSGT